MRTKDDVTNGGGVDVGVGSSARERLRCLIIEHLEFEEVPADLLRKLRAFLEKASEHQRDSAQESELLHLVLTCDAASKHHGNGSAGAQRSLAQTSELSTGCIEESLDHEHAEEIRTESTDVLAVSSETDGIFQSLLPVGVVISLSLIYAPCVAYSEWYIDELFAAVRNADARGETPLRKLLTHDFWGNSLWDGQWTHKSYRPLVILSYALQYWFNNNIIKPQALRAFNVALHTTNSVLLFILLRRQRAPRRWACLGAGLFAAHPTHAENIIYLVGRADALATHCWLLALLAWPLPTSATTRGICSGFLRLMLVTLLAVIGGLCKETGFLILFQVSVGELLSRQPLRNAAPPLIAFGLVYSARSWLTSGTSAGFSYVDTPVQYHSDPNVRFFTYLYFHSKYAQLLALPWALSWDYSYDALPLLRETWQDARVLGILAVYLGISAIACWSFTKRNRHVLFGLSNIIVPFIPASNLFFIVGTTIGERLLYPCNAGGAMLLSAFCSHRHFSSRSGKARGSRLSFLLGLLLLSVFSYRCGLRVYQWQSREHLFGADLESYPRSAKARHQMGTVLHRQGRFDEALINFETSLSIFSDNALSEYCIAQIYIEMGRPHEALPRFEHILQGHGLGFGGFNLYALYVDYGFTLMMLRRFQDAVPPLQQGLALNEDVPHGLNALGYCYMQLQLLQDARKTFERGLHYDPTNSYLLNNCGVARMLMGQIDGSEMIVRAATQDPAVPAFLHNMRVLQELSQTQRWPSEQLALELFYNRGS